MPDGGFRGGADLAQHGGALQNDWIFLRHCEACLACVRADIDHGHWKISHGVCAISRVAFAPSEPRQKVKCGYALFWERRLTHTST